MTRMGRGSAGLLLLPFLALSLIVPAPLGAFSAERDGGSLRQPPPPDTWLPPLPATTAPVTMTLTEYSERAVFEKGKSLAARRVRLVGFVSRRAGSNGTGWRPPAQRHLGGGHRLLGQERGQRR